MEQMVNTLYSIFRQQFQVISDRGGDIHPSATLKLFNSPLTTQRFLTEQIKASASYWRHFLNRQLSLTTPLNALNDAQIIDKIVELVMRKRIRFYELPQISHNVMAHNGKGKGYNFIKGPGKLPDGGSEAPLDIKIEAEAVQILTSLEVEERYWHNYLKEQGLEQDKVEAAKGQDITSYVAGLMVSGEIVIYTRAYAPPPPMPDVTSLLEPRVDKKAPLGPEVIKAESIYVNFQVDVSETSYRNDKLTLIHSGGEYESSLTLGSLQVFDYDWVRLEFPDPPQSGKYTLKFDAQEGDESDIYTIFEDVPFASLSDLTPDLDAGY